MPEICGLRAHGEGRVKEEAPTLHDARRGVFCLTVVGRIEGMCAVSLVLLTWIGYAYTPPSVDKRKHGFPGPVSAPGGVFLLALRVSLTCEPGKGENAAGAGDGSPPRAPEREIRQQPGRGYHPEPAQFPPYPAWGPLLSFYPEPYRAGRLTHPQGQHPVCGYPHHRQPGVFQRQER